jgi:hypothetical protein
VEAAGVAAAAVVGADELSELAAGVAELSVPVDDDLLELPPADASAALRESVK